MCHNVRSVVYCCYYRYRVPRQTLTIVVANVINRFFYPRLAFQCATPPERRNRKRSYRPTTVITIIVIIGTRARRWPRLSVGQRTNDGVRVLRTSRQRVPNVSSDRPLFRCEKPLVDHSSHLQARVRISNVTTDNDSRASNGLMNRN